MTDAQVAGLSSGKLRGLRVLIVEDSWLIADTLSVLLEEEGVAVVGPCPTNEAAVIALQQGTVDFALVDLALGDAFADQVVDDLIARNIPYAIITGYGALPTNADARAVKVLRKPIDRKALVELLDHHVVRPRER